MNFIQPLSSSSLLNSPKPTQSPKQTSSVSNVNRQLKHEFPRLFKSSTVDDFNLFQKTSKSRKISLSTQNILSYPFISSQDLDHYTSSIKYSARYNDDQFQYRHVTIPPFLYDHLDSKFKNRLLDELEWRSMGITMSEGWYLFINVGCITNCLQESRIFSCLNGILMISMMSLMNCFLLGWKRLNHQVVDQVLLLEKRDQVLQWRRRSRQRMFVIP